MMRHLLLLFFTVITIAADIDIFNLQIYPLLSGSSVQGNYKCEDFSFDGGAYVYIHCLQPSNNIQTIQLWYKNLNGYLPFQLSSLTRLEKLGLRGNSLGGVLSASALPASLLELDLSSNLLVGSIPSNLPSSLRILNLQGNPSFGGVGGLPSTWPTTLVDLRLDQTSIGGAQLPPFPPSLKTFWATQLDISGTLPPLPAALEDFQMSKGRLSGALPSLAATSLVRFEVQENSGLGGTLSQLPSSLQWIDVSNNMQISGTLPELPASLVRLSVFSTQISGTLPTWSHTKLTHATLYGTGIVGTLPPFPSSLVYLNLNNRWEFVGGTIPPLTHCLNLTNLLLYNNGYSGQIPALPGKVEYLLLDNNRFSGLINISASLPLKQCRIADTTSDVEYSCYQCPAFALHPLCTSPSIQNPCLSPYKESCRMQTGTPTPFPTPVPPTLQPSRSPTQSPSPSPSKAPTAMPSHSPTPSPSPAPSPPPTPTPTHRPSGSPTPLPTPTPTRRPSPLPSDAPTKHPTLAPSKRPTPLPTMTPTVRPSMQPTRSPSPSPSAAPSPQPTARDLSFDPCQQLSSDQCWATNFEALSAFQISTWFSSERDALTSGGVAENWRVLDKKLVQSARVTSLLTTSDYCRQSKGTYTLFEPRFTQLSSSVAATELRVWVRVTDAEVADAAVGIVFAYKNAVEHARFTLSRSCASVGVRSVASAPNFVILDDFDGGGFVTKEWVEIRLRRLSSTNMEVRWISQTIGVASEFLGLSADEFGAGDGVGVYCSNAASCEFDNVLIAQADLVPSMLFGDWRQDDAFCARTWRKELFDNDLSALCRLL